MAEWRERGYVPDSDEEDDEDLGGTPRRGWAQNGTQGPRPSNQSAVPVNRETYDHLSREAQDGLEEALPESASAWEGASSEHQGRSSTNLAIEDREDTIETTELAFAEEPDSLLPSLAYVRENGQVLHDVDHMDIDDPPHSSPVANELQATLDLGLKQVSEILRNSQRSNERGWSSSESSSPLSSLGSLEHELNKDDSAVSPRITLPQFQAAGPPTGPSPQRSPEVVAPQRALRQRTQIQMHPYALEDARYQQELKARGLKPVRIAAIQSQQPHGSLQSAGDEAPLFSSSPVYEESAPISAHDGTQEELSFHHAPVQNEDFDHSDSPLRLDDDDEDLPDLATIFRDDPPRSTTASLRKYRAAPTAVFRLPERQQYIDVFDFLADEEDAHHAPAEPATFFVPPSPPRSGSTSASDKIHDTQSKESQRRPTPKRLPTPLLSSEAHSRKRPVVELPDSSEDLSDRTAGSDSFSSDEDDTDKVGKIKSMKRRMKGVLPASWLKLDLKKQTVGNEDRRFLHARPEISNGKGVAKPVSASRPQTGLALPSSTSRREGPQFSFSDEEPSSDERMELDRADYSNTGEGSPDHGSTDVLEDNRVDTMQPVRKRRPTSSSKPRRKRQQRPSNTWQDVREKANQQNSINHAHGTSNRRLHKAPTTKRQRKHKLAPRLTVLDAPGFVQLPRAEQPRFLKVAARRAQRDTRKSTQSSRGKFLKLATEGDTGDINRSLRQWQDGHIQPHHIHHSLSAAIDPATDKSSLPPETTDFLDTNHLEIPPSTTSNPTTALGALKNSTDATIQRILFRQQGLPPRPSREAASTASTTHITASLARLRVGINLRKPIPNRAGLGSLQTAPTHTRAAQVEHPAPDRSSTSLFGSATFANNISHQHVNRVSTVQPLTNVIEAEDQLATHTLQPARSSKTLKVNTNRNRKAPQRTRTVILSEPRHSTPSGSLPVVRGSDRTSEELNVVIDIMADLSRTDGEGVTNDGWSTLWPPLQKWLEVYSDKPSMRTPIEKRRAKEIFTLYRELVSRFGWPTAWDDMIRKAAWFFSSFDMVDPFDSRNNPQLGLPPFLNEMKSAMGDVTLITDITTYHIFLDILAVSLSQRSLEATNTSEGLATRKRKKTELQSFVNRLYPNNGRLLSEHEEIRKVDLASLWNRCSLYLTLYCFSSEECRPRLSQFQNLVDVKKSHIKACDAMLDVWRVLACFHAQTPESSQHDRLAEMGVWMQSMILTMVLKWVEARREVELELEIDTPERNEGDDLHINQNAMKILRANQSSVEKFVREALFVWTRALKKCECQSTAVQLINIGQLDMVLDNLTAFFTDNNNDDTMLQRVLILIDQYLHRYSTADHPTGSPAHRVVLVISGAIHKTLCRRLDTESKHQERPLERYINRKLTYDWCLVASALVTAKTRSWDDFLEPAGRYSWERFENPKRSAVYQTLFLAFIIKSKEEVYRDNKFWYLRYWVKALLRPSHEFVFEHELSTAMLKADQYEPILMNLPLLIKGGSDGSSVQMAVLEQNRTNVLGMIVENIANASNNYDSQAVDPYALQPPEMADLLRVMMNTMRLTRSNLDHGSKERDEYELMVCKLADKMERYTSSIVPLERWLTDTDVMAFNLYHLRKRFGGPAPTTGTILVPKQEIFWFQTTCQKAALEGTAYELSEVIRSVYVDASEISEIEWYQPKMLAMMEQVFPAYLELALTDRGALMGAPLLNVLDSICEKALMRALSIGTEDHTQLLGALYGIIVSARVAMQRSNVDRDVVTVFTWPNLTEEDKSFLIPEPARTRVLAFASVVRIARIAISQFREVVRYAKLPGAQLDGIRPHMLYINVFVKSLVHCLQDGQDGHWSEMVEAEWHHLADVEADEVKKFAAEVLERQLRLDWTTDSAGTWWVMQGRQAVSVQIEKTDGLKGPNVRKFVEDEMAHYRYMYDRVTTEIA